jgi:fatty acid desaturase
MLYYASGMIFLGLSLHLLDYLCHIPPNLRSEDVHINSEGYMRLSRDVLRALKFKSCDNVLGASSFIRIYLYMCAAGILFNHYESILVKCLMILYVSCRLRALQELSHFAVHGVLCPSFKLGHLLANIFYQYPLGLPTASARYQSHVFNHHPNPNIPNKDPNLQDYINIGFAPGITVKRFWLSVLHPFSVKGIADRLQTYFNVWKDDRIPRIIVIATIILPLIIFGLWGELICLYLIPCIIIHPFLAWISQLVEHRWFYRIKASSGLEIQYAYGKVIEFPGLFGRIIKHNFFPFGDAYHLVHSLYPTIRWNYLRAVHMFCKEHDARYRSRMNSGILWGAGENVSALRELMNDMRLN